MIRISFPLLFLLITLSSGCSLKSSSGKQITSSLSPSQITHALKQQHQQWKGVRYKMGGLSRKGVDCSGFVYRLYKDGLGVKLPRSTELQSQLGEHVSKSQLKVGDLVFFKTGGLFKSRHVGIYAGSNQFIHASTSRGVMKSNLNNPYWREAYWQSKRVLKQAF